MLNFSSNWSSCFLPHQMSVRQLGVHVTPQPASSWTEGRATHAFNGELFTSSLTMGSSPFSSANRRRYQTALVPL